MIAFIHKDKFLYTDFRSTKARMLPLTHRQPYQKFQQALQQMPESPAYIVLEYEAISQKLPNLQQLFKSEIAPLDADDLASDYASRWQSVQTEFFRQMRLLETDVMLWKAARHNATSLMRATGICERIKTLNQYCEVLLQL